MDDHKMTYEDIILLLLYRNRSFRITDAFFAVCRERIRVIEGISVAHDHRGCMTSNVMDSYPAKKICGTRRSPCMAYSLTPLGVLRAKSVELSKLGAPHLDPGRKGRVDDIAVLRRRANALREGHIEQD